MKTLRTGNTIVNALKGPRVAAFFAVLLLSACGGGGSSSSDSDGSGSNGGGSGGSTAPLTAAVPNLAFASVKTFRFSWTDVSDATYYKLLENPDGHSGFTQVGSDIQQGTQSIDHVVPLYARVNAQYLLQTCNAVGCNDSATVSVSGTLVDSVGYVKASTAEDSDSFGRAVSLSTDGDTLAVGASGEDSNATGVNGDQSNDDASYAGAVYVFARTGASWTQQAYVKASNAEASDDFGVAVSLSADGDTLAVGAYGEASNATGVNGDQSNNDAGYAGAVYVLTRTDGTWTQQAYIKASNAETYDFFGSAVSLSGDGDTLAVGAPNENSNATGVNGDQNDLAGRAGAVYVFTHTDGSWTQQAYVKASNTEASDDFGVAVSLSADGGTLAVGADGESSNATGVNGDQSNNAAGDAGAVYVFTRTDGNWTQQAYVKASNAEGGDYFGSVVSLSAGGDTLAVGAWGESSNAAGVNGDQGNDDASQAGAVYVFTRTDGGWTQQAYVKASNAEASDFFGYAISLSGDGDTLAVGAYGEDSIATGVNGELTNNSADGAGAVYVFTRADGSWTQQTYVKASNAATYDFFGMAVSLSTDGDTLAVGVPNEDSNATGVNGDQSNDDARSAGAVYLY